ncbi:ABC transporter substrate-binding protein [Microbacteriaceae bacterium VKM Ac-2854]|nr:ABC transporter substrate-binding protein [Microbacteriaceae bacterium VKM Ac-2854]
MTSTPRPRRHQRHRRRWQAATAVAVAAAFALTACAGGSSAEPSASASAETPQEGGRLKLAFWPDNAAFSCVDPFQVYWIEHRTVIRNFADSLTDQDPETGEITPWLATDWSINDAGTEYTFNLRDDVTFSDGTTFDANSVKTAFDNDKATAAAVPGAFGASYIAGYDSTEVVDDDTVIVKFATPNAAFLQATSTTTLAVLAPSSYAQTPEQRCLGEGVIGSGPFTLDSYVPGTSLSLTKRDGYAWGSELRAHTGAAYLDVSYVAEDSVRVGQLTSDAVDIAWPRNPFTENDQALITAGGDSIESRSLPGPASNYYPNTSAGHVLADPDVRTAVQKALDLESYASTIYGADYPVVSSVFDTTTPGYEDESALLAHDAKGAAKLLDDAGWALGDDGYRSKDGQKLTLSIPVSAALPGDQLVQDQLKAVGIDVELNVITAAQRSEVLSSGEYDLIGSYLTRADPSVIQSIIDSRYATSKALAANLLTPEQSATVQGLIDEGTTTIDQTARAKVYAELSSYLLENALVFPTFERVQLAGFSSAVHGFRYTSEAFGDFADTWLEQ